MRSVCRKILLVLPLFATYFIATSQTIQSITNFNKKLTESLFFVESSEIPVATNDTVNFCSDCGNESFSINIMANDSKSYADSFMVYIWKCPNKGIWSIKKDGEFIFTNTNNFLGTLTFIYKIYKIGYPEQATEAQIIVNIMVDTDCDGVMDEFDIDDDNDGIIDVDDGLTTDTDNDGIPNYLDIDSDNDGIPDNIEGQLENHYILPLYSDLDGDGLDDAYDPHNGGGAFSLTDTDGDGTPDFTDTNSDNDEFDDLTEAYDANFDTIPDIDCSYKDCDKDGLDDSFDTVEGWLIASNSVGHGAPLPDYDKDGIRDWRDAVSNKPIPGDENPLQGFGQYFTVYPNPAQDFIRLKLPDEILENEITLDICTVRGKLLLKTFYSHTNDQINISNLESGVYVVRINSGSYSQTRRLIISR